MLELVRIEEVNLAKGGGFCVLHPLAFAAYQEGDLEKGRTHKYLKREPYTTKTGKKRYRYWYKMPKKAEFVSETSLKLGSAFKYGFGDKAGHFHITAVASSDMLIITHDETGKTVTTSLVKLKALLAQQHAMSMLQAATHRPTLSAEAKKSEEKAAAAKKAAAEAKKVAAAKKAAAKKAADAKKKQAEKEDQEATSGLDDNAVIVGTITHKKVVNILDYLQRFVKSNDGSSLKGSSSFTVDEVKQVQKYLDLWTGGRYQVVRDPSLFDATKVRKEAGKFFEFTPTKEDYVEANKFLKWATVTLPCKLSKGKPVAQKLYRGIRLGQEDAAALLEKVGQPFDLMTASSFSSEFGVAKFFSTPEENFQRRVIITVEAKKGLDVGDLSRYPNEKETVLGGSMKIKSVTLDKASLGSPYLPAYLVTLEQE